jgi:hypothetical protein
MPDRVEREIEEILAKLDSEPKASAKRPVPINSRRNRNPGPARRPRPSLPMLDTTTLLFAGAGIMVAGLVLATFWSPLIWASFAGVVLFLGAFAMSFFRSGRPVVGGSAPKGHYWRDRYIEYTPPSTGGPVDRVRRKLWRR